MQIATDSYYGSPISEALALFREVVRDTRGDNDPILSALKVSLVFPSESTFQGDCWIVLEPGHFELKEDEIHHIDCAATDIHPRFSFLPENEKLEYVRRFIGASTSSIIVDWHHSVIHDARLLVTQLFERIPPDSKTIMTKLYAILYAVETGLRNWICVSLDKWKNDWWNDVPTAVQDAVKRYKSGAGYSFFDFRPERDIQYTDFPHLQMIIQHLQDHLPLDRRRELPRLSTYLTTIENYRPVVAHCNLLSDPDCRAFEIAANSILDFMKTRRP